MSHDDQSIEFSQKPLQADEMPETLGYYELGNQHDNYH